MQRESCGITSAGVTQIPSLRCFPQRGELPWGDPRVPSRSASLFPLRGLGAAPPGAGSGGASSGVGPPALLPSPSSSSPPSQRRLLGRAGRAPAGEGTGGRGRGRAGGRQAAREAGSAAAAADAAAAAASPPATSCARLARSATARPRSPAPAAAPRPRGGGCRARLAPAAGRPERSGAHTHGRARGGGKPKMLQLVLGKVRTLRWSPGLAPPPPPPPPFHPCPPEWGFAAGVWWMLGRKQAGAAPIGEYGGHRHGARSPASLPPFLSPSGFSVRAPALLPSARRPGAAFLPADGR